MKKLLLLTVSLSSFALSIFASDSYSFSDSVSALSFYKDSSIVLVKANPKKVFKNLFEEVTLTPGITTQNLNPQALNFVHDYLDKNGSYLNNMKDWGKPYFDMMDNVLDQHNLPVELKYLSVIESNLNSSAVSWVGAVGPWQFMPATARQLGLRVTKYADDRKDFYKSTKAAARYLNTLYSQFGDWLLVIAAYNGGPGNVNAAIRKSKSRNFWDLQYFLPEESRMHVKKFIATHYIMEGQGGVTTITKKESDKLLMTAANTASNAGLGTVEIDGGSRYSSVVIANLVNMEYAAFNKLNPDFDNLLATTDADKSIMLRLPADKLLLFQANKMQILEQSMRLMMAMN